MRYNLHDFPLCRDRIPFFSVFFFLISHIWKIKINKKKNTDNSFACTVAFWNELEIFIIV